MVFGCFLIPSDSLAAMIGPVSSCCILYIVVVFVFVVLWTHESGIKKYIIKGKRRAVDMPARIRMKYDDFDQ